MLINHLTTLYHNRNLIRTLAWLEFRQRYKNSILGYFWSLLEPLLMLAVLYIVFSNLMKIEVEFYALFLLLGIIIWNFLSRATMLSLTAITGRPSLVQKVYFPRDILVISLCVTALLMSVFESIVFIIFMVILSVPISSTLIFIPLIVVILFLLVLGISLSVAALNVSYRDIQFIWAVILQAGFFITPILYPITIFPENIAKLILLNPMAPIVIEARNIVIYSTPPTTGSLFYAGILSLIVMVTGFLIFFHYEPGFAEEM